VIVDASHANSGKDHRQQAAVAARIADVLIRDDPGIAGLMVESFLIPGRQDLTTGRPPALSFGQSVTDACMGWDDTSSTLDVLAGAVAQRRTLHPHPGASCGLASGVRA
jgi:3-deoxy-7-phosphoheptulonate synthase